MSKNQFSLVTGSLFLSLSLVGCFGSKPVATVGDTKITQDQVELRLKMMKVLSPNSTEKAVKEQLIRSASLSEILKSKGISVTDEMTTSEFKKMEMVAKSNPKIASLMKDFGSNKKFKELYIVPTLIENLAFREGFQKDAAFHSEEQEKMTKLLNEAKNNPAKLEELANQLGIAVKQGVLKEKEGLEWMTTDRSVTSMPLSLPKGPGFGKFFKKNFLDKTPAGKVSQSIESIGQFSMIIRNDSSSKNAAKFTVAMLPRKNFGDWFNSNRQKLKVTRVE